jgi:hypothetical protein
MQKLCQANSGFKATTPPCCPLSPVPLHTHRSEAQRQSYEVSTSRPFLFPASHTWSHQVSAGARHLCPMSHNKHVTQSGWQGKESDGDRDIWHREHESAPMVCLDMALCPLWSLTHSGVVFPVFLFHGRVIFTRPPTGTAKPRIFVFILTRCVLRTAELIPRKYNSLAGFDMSGESGHKRDAPNVTWGPIQGAGTEQCEPQVDNKHPRLSHRQGDEEVLTTHCPQEKGKHRVPCPRGPVYNS